MSTGNECAFYGFSNGEWFYVLEDYNAPKNAWDWREYATAYGPFKSFDEAYTHLCDNHANPGGFSAPQEATDDLTKIDEVLAKLIADARKRGTRGRRM